MKFLDTKEISDSQGDVEIIFKPVSMVNKSALFGYNVNIYEGIKVNDSGMTAAAKMKSVAYTLLNMVSKLTVKGEVIDHIECGNCADVNDPETLRVLNAIYDMATSLMVEGETRKKSSAPRKPTSKVSVAKDAPEATKE